MSLDILFAELTSTRLSLPYENLSLFYSADINVEDSRTYNFNGAKMAADIDIVIPIVYGRHLIAPNLINAYIEEGEHETLNMLLAVCEGEIDSISNIKLNGEKIENFYGEEANDPYGENAEITIKTGTTAQTVIENFDDIHSVQAVEQELTKNIPYEYTTTISNAEAFKLEFLFDQLYQVDSNQNQLSWYASIQVEVRLNGDVDWLYLGIVEINNQTESELKRYFKSDYGSPGKYDVRVTKLSDDADSTHFGTLTLNSVDEITTQSLVYPSTALIGLRFIASEKLSGSIPNVICVVSGEKVRIPDVRDGSDNPVAWEDYYWDSAANAFKLFSTDISLNWDGTTYTTAWSANNAWCLRDLLLNERYGLGQYISADEIDDASFLAAAKFCDEGVDDLEGNKEKRMMLDIVLDTPDRALNVINRICNTFRGLLHISAGKIRLVVEKTEDSSYNFNMSSIIAGSFVMQYVSNKNIPNVLTVQYTNKDKDYRQDSVELGDNTAIEAGASIRQKSVQMYGCTRTSQALREATILLKKLKHHNKPISFRTGYSALPCEIGDVVSVQHDLPAWGDGGRVACGSTTTLVSLDKAVILDLGSTYEIEVKRGHTDTIEKRTVLSAGGQFTEVEVTSVFSFTPEKYDEWSLGIQNQVNEPCRITSIERSYDGLIQIGAVNYVEAAYDASGVETPEDEFKYLLEDIPNVTNLIVEEKAIRLADGTIDDIINVSYLKPITGSRWIKNVVKFEIYLSSDNGISWLFVGVTDKEFWTIKKAFIVGQRYTVAVVSVTDNGDSKVAATSPQVSLAIQGWIHPPSNVSGFNYTFTDEIVFAWDKVSDSNLSGYEIRTENDNWGTNGAGFVWRGNANIHTIVSPTARDGISYYIKAYNTSAKFSDVVEYVTPQNTLPAAVDVTHIDLFQKVFLMWTDSPDADLQYYEVWRNDTCCWYGCESVLSNECMVHKATGTSAVVEVPNDPTYYRVRAMDKFGGGDWSNIIDACKKCISNIDIDEGAITTVHIGDNVITAPKILAGSITSAKILAAAIEACHISANAVTADKIDVNCLSAISSDIGCILAGTIIGACYKTSNETHRTELNSGGLFSYDRTGGLRIKLSDGELCLISQNDSETYSYLDYGALKFHYPYGEVPYLKRLCAGCACTGSTLVFCQWYEKPEVIASIKRLYSYSPDKSESCQEWCVYANNTRYYDNGAGDFGWCVDVHATLVVSGGTRAECIYLSNFETVESTGSNTCRVITKDLFQLWCHGVAPDTYKYGGICYQMRYRVSGCGVWCACNYTYLQAHSTISEMLCTAVTCHTVQFMTPETYEVQFHQTDFCWWDSGILSGSVVCCLCCYLVCDQICEDHSWWATCVINATLNFCCNYWTNTAPYGCARFSDTLTMNFGSWIGYYVCRSQLIYIISGHAIARPAWSYMSPGSTGVQACTVVWGEYGGGATACACQYYGQHGVCGCGYCCSSYNNTIQAMLTCYIPSTWFATSVYLKYLDYVGSGFYGEVNLNVSACQIVCYKVCCVCYYWNCWWCCYWYCICCGDPACCDYKKFYSMQETTAEECILDPDGEINYLAAAYA